MTDPYANTNRVPTGYSFDGASTNFGVSPTNEPRDFSVNSYYHDVDEQPPSEENLPLIGSYPDVKHLKGESLRSFRDFTHNKDLRNSVYIMLFTIFLQSMGFSIVLPSLWFYLTKQPTGLDADQFIAKPSVSFLGYVVAIYSFGQAVSSPLFGWWSNRAPSKFVVIVTLFIACVGNTLYAIARDVFPIGNVYNPIWHWVVFVARFLVGVSAGNVAVCRAYCSHASDINNRSKIMAWMSAAQGIGFGLGPAWGAALSHINFNIGILHIDAYTSVGLLSAFFALVNALALIWIRFQELPHATAAANIEPTNDKEFKNIMVILVLFFVTIGVFSIFETMASVVLEHFYKWHELQIGLLFVGASFVGVIAYISVSHPCVTKRFEEKQLLLAGLVFTVLSLIALPSWTFVGEAVPSLAQFLAGALLLSFAYPISTVEIVILYSKVVHPKAQGTKMGWLTAAGSLSRMLCPIYASNVWQWTGTNITNVPTSCVQCNDGSDSASVTDSGSCDPTNFCDASLALFFSTAGAVVVAVLLVIAAYRILVPHPYYTKEQNAGGTTPGH
eukprot:TRINITY_DN287_c0_g5_i2.p1 TRINITY_DN287_c0_g5~~TRINITY_DN287_c0_g5_i2.p1  ORF type:complete len:557 (-),score=81.72 TRINITY_DN287_c0_g5_i2:312-1982(-)